MLTGEKPDVFEIIPDGPHRSKPLAGVVYTCIQSVAFTLLAIMIMRMKEMLNIFLLAWSIF